MKSLVIGASGLVGMSCALAFEQYGPVFRASRNGNVRLDIRNREHVEEVISRLSPEVVILCAAYTNVDGCEEKQDVAFQTNVIGAQNVAEASRNAKIVYLSTDYVFDGTAGPYDENAPTNPVNFYGKTKLEAERCMRQVRNHLIIRTTNVFDLPEEKNFVSRCLKNFSEGNIITCPIDQYATPTWARTLGNAIGKLVEKGATGIYNVVGPDYLTRAEFAQKVAEKFGYSKNLVKGVCTSELHQLAPRPLLGGLRIEKARAEIDMDWQTLEEALDFLIIELCKTGGQNI